MSVLDRFVAPATRRPLPLIFLAFIAMLWLAGGASRADVFGQALIRGTAWLCVAAIVLLDHDRSIFVRGRPVAVLLGVAAILAILQLIPLPPDLWARLPGRAAFADANAIIGGSPPWRPLAIVPSAAGNALASLIVPAVMLCFASAAGRIRDMLLLKGLLGMAVASMVVGLLQFAGMSLYDPLINRGDDIVGTFGNHNHFALMMACGLLLAPVWALLDGRRPGWRGPVVIGLIPLFTLTILASGSRAGMVAGIIALICGLLIVRRPLKSVLSRAPRWAFLTVVAGLPVALAGLITLSIAADRAVSINRALVLDPAQDMRSRSIPTVFSMIREYWPTGAGLGGFDQIFRMHEPFDLLKLTYFNRAHNDFAEIVLDTGIFGASLLAVALGWWCWMSIRAWRGGSGAPTMLPRLGSALLLIIMLASIVDYPARTPIFMAVIVVAGVWLSLSGRAGSPLRSKAQRL